MIELLEGTLIIPHKPHNLFSFILFWISERSDNLENLSYKINKYIRDLENVLFFFSPLYSTVIYHGPNEVPWIDTIWLKKVII